MSKAIKIRQNWGGNYNLFNSEKTLSFIMDIVDENNKTIEIGGVKARLQLNQDIDSFDSPKDNIETVFEECWKHANTVWSSTNYKAQCLLFAKTFQENYQELCENRIREQKEEISKEIERLQNNLKSLYGFDDISYIVNKGIKEEIETYNKWIKQNKEELAQIKENTEKYIEIQNKIVKYQKEVDFYTNSIIEECYYE